MSRMSDDEILRTAARLILNGYPPDSFIQCFEKFPPAFRVQKNDGKYSNGGEHWNFGPNGKRYNKLAHVKSSIPRWEPKREDRFSRYWDCHKRIHDGHVVETVEIPVRRIPLSDIFEEKERLGEQKLGR